MWLVAGVPVAWENLSELQRVQGVFVKPAGGANPVVPLESSQGRPRAVTERSVDAATIVTEFPEPDLCQCLDAHLPAFTTTPISIPAPVATTAVVFILLVIVVFVVTVVIVATFIPRFLAGAEEEFERPCFGNACGSDQKRAQCDDWDDLNELDGFHDRDETTGPVFLFTRI